MNISQNNPVLLRVDNIKKSFNNQEILQDISFEVNTGEFVTLLGISGSGKSTLFNIIAGLDQPDQGRIFYGEEDITGTSGHLAYMLQKDLLLRHLKIIDNVCLPLYLSGMKKDEARKKASPYFKEFGIEGTQDKYPLELSGGMAQRAAFLRTFLFNSEMILLDEPFSALDAITRKKLQEWYKDIRLKYKLTTLFITHDVEEALFLSDTIYVLSPTKHTFVAKFHLPSQSSREEERSILKIDGIRKDIEKALTE